MEISESRKVLFFQKVQKGPSCWLWTGRANKKGYGKTSLNSKGIFVHRLSLMICGIQIPKGMVVDHVCRIRRCVNPNHLRVVTARTNSLENSVSSPAINARKTHCYLGHEFTQENTIYLKNGSRLCRKCKNKRRARLRSLMTPEQRRKDRGRR